MAPTNTASTRGFFWPFWWPYVDYVGKIVLTRLSAARLRDRQPVRDLSARFPVTAQLAMWTILFAVSIGLPVGVFARAITTPGSSFGRDGHGSSRWLPCQHSSWDRDALLFAVKLGGLPSAAGSITSGGGAILSSHMVNPHFS